MFRMYARNLHSYTHLILARVSLESLQYGYLLLHNILAYMTLACLSIRASPRVYFTGVYLGPGLQIEGLCVQNVLVY